MPVLLIKTRAAEAARWLHVRSLASVQPVTPTARSVARIRSSRTRLRYAPMLRAYDALQALVGRMEPEAVQRSIERTGLVVAEDWALFELLVTFELLDALESAGWAMEPLRLFGGSLRTDGTRSDGRRVTLWYQGTPSPLPTGSAYKGTLLAHGFTQARDPVPDQVLRWQDPAGSTRWLIVENKLSDRGVDTAARRALQDLLFYRRAFDATLRLGGQPYGLGVPWGRDLVPTTGEVLLATPDRLASTIAALMP